MIKSHFENILWALACTIFFITLKEYARQIAYADLKFLSALIIDIFVFIFQLIIIFIMVLYGILNSTKTILIIGIASGFVGTAWLLKGYKEMLFIKTRFLHDLKTNWSLGKWIFMTNIAIIGSVQTYPWVLNSFHGASSTAIYVACQNVIFIINPVLIGFSNYLGPKTAEAYKIGNIDGVRRIVLKGTAIMAIIMICFTTTIFVLGGLIVELIYGNQYSGNATIISILAMSQMALAITFPINQGLIVLERSDVGFKSYLLAFIIVFIFGIMLVKYYGPIGAAIGLLFGNTAASMYRILYFKKCIKVPAIQ